MGKKIGGAIGSVSIILGLVFGIWKIEDRYATADDMKSELNTVVADVAKEVYQLQQSDVEQKQKTESLEIRLDVKLFSDYRDELQGRIWKMDDRYGIGCAECDPVVSEVYTGIVTDIEKIDKKLKALEEGGTE